MIRELETRHGTMFVPDTDTAQYWWLANSGASPEDEYIDLVCGIIPKGMAVDVGANFGCWTLPLAKYAESVIAIEPQRCCFDLLKRSTSSLPNVEVIHAAASDSEGELSIAQLNIESSANFGGLSVNLPVKEQPEAKMEKVRVVTLDRLLAEKSISFIKIDVEGHEAKVIAGSKKTITRCKPILFVEMDHPLTDSNSLRETIEGMNYTTEKIGGNFLGLPL